MTVPRIATNNNRNVLLNSLYSTSFPPKFNSYKHVLLSKSAKIITLKADTGTTANHIWDKYIIILKKPQQRTTGPRVLLPENSIIWTILTGHLPLSTLPSAATQFHAYINLNSSSLLSIGQLCDSYCSTFFTKNDVTIFNSDNTPVLNRKQDTYGGLWDVAITSSQPESSPTVTTTPKANSILCLDKTKS